MDFYIILGIERGATLDDIKRAYKRLARKFHPDINPGDRMAAAQFRQIAEAYETLSDPDRRQRYDTTGPSVVERRGGFTFGFEGFDFSVSVSGAVGVRRSAISSPTCSGSASDGADEARAGAGRRPASDDRRSASRTRCAAAQRSMTVMRAGALPRLRRVAAGWK